MHRIVIGSVLALLCLVGCGGTASDTPAPAALQPTRAASLEMGADIPAPRGRVILTLSGAVQHPNRGNDLVLDRATVDRMPQFDVSIFEPFLKRDVHFSGVLLSDLFGYAGTDAASSVRLTALDDFRITLNLGELQAAQVLLATRVDGEPIAVPDGGPDRLVYLNGATGLGANTDNWIWSINDMLFQVGS